MFVIHLPFSPPGKKLVKIDNFSNVVYLFKIGILLDDQDLRYSSILSLVFLSALTLAE